jgi:hypothetical protein
MNDLSEYILPVRQRRIHADAILIVIERVSRTGEEIAGALRQTRSRQIVLQQRR